MAEETGEVFVSCEGTGLKFRQVEPIVVERVYHPEIAPRPRGGGMNIAKVKQHFTHKGKSYKPGDNFESEDLHEIQTLASQGHLEHPTIGQQHGPGGQAQAQGAPYPGTDQPKETGQHPSGTHDPGKQR